MTQTLDIQPGDRILVSRTDRLGDLILALPLVETLKVRYPECEVHVMASLYASPILENNPRIDGILRVQNDQLRHSRPYKKELLQKVVAGRYKAVVVVYPDRLISQLFYKANIPLRLGTAGRFHSVYFNQRLFHSRKANKKHELEYNLDFLKFFKSGKTVRTPRVYPTAKELANADRLLREVGISGGFIVLHPGSGGSAHRWPMERFPALYEELSNEGHQVVVTGSEEEGKRFRQLITASDRRPPMLTGQTDLRTLAAVLSHADLLVANSTGPLHLAAAVGTRVAGLYPRQKVMSPLRWGPRGKGHAIIQPDSPECDCPPPECRCMDTIEAERVARIALETLGRPVEQK